MRILAPGTQSQYSVATGLLPVEARAALAPDASLLALARGTALDVWSVTTGARLQQWEFGAGVSSLTFAAPAARPTLAIGLSNGVVEVWG
jgi:hypothetical protein